MTDRNTSDADEAGGVSSRGIAFRTILPRCCDTTEWSLVVPAPGGEHNEADEPGGPVRDGHIRIALTEAGGSGSSTIAVVRDGDAEEYANCVRKLRRLWNQINDSFGREARPEDPVWVARTANWYWSVSMVLVRVFKNNLPPDVADVMARIRTLLPHHVFTDRYFYSGVLN